MVVVANSAIYDNKLENLQKPRRSYKYGTGQSLLAKMKHI
jgi:hypothetical protein